MSVIHDAVKRAREAQSQKKAPMVSESAPQVTVRASSTGRQGWIWLMLFFVLAEAALFFWQSQKNHRMESKLQSAYLELNDVRGEYLDVKKVQVDSESKYRSELELLQRQVKEAILAKAEIANAKQSVEFDNLDKEKAIARLKTEKHLSEMERFKLEDEVKALQKELQKWSSPLPLEAQTASGKSPRAKAQE